MIGSIAMARTNDPHSATSQFFINLVNNDFLDFRSKTPPGWGYTVFGKVTAGMDVVNRIAKSRTGYIGGMQDVPMDPIVIQKATYKP
ncbi:Peptidyl-prolyl cis-trans isomerase cyp18 [compost metagenome]